MYGKAFESMYDGSMIGSGLNVFAVWNYVVAKTRRGVIELNPKLLAFILGGKEDEIDEAIARLCAPDPKSRSKQEEGRRLIKEGEYQYRVVNWELYSGIRNEIERREYNRVKQAEYRAAKTVKSSRKKKVGPSPKELAAAKAYDSGNTALGDAIAAHR
jgi:hypothetical protein